MTKLAFPVRRNLQVDTTSPTATYIGEAAFSSATSDPVWRIYRVSTIGTNTSITWADGDDEFDNVWDNRSSLTYI